MDLLNIQEIMMKLIISNYNYFIEKSMNNNLLFL
jgi:hypothetical protein